MECNRWPFPSAPLPLRGLAFLSSSLFKRLITEITLCWVEDQLISIICGDGCVVVSRSWYRFCADLFCCYLGRDSVLKTNRTNEALPVFDFSSEYSVNIHTLSWCGVSSIICRCRTSGQTKPPPPPYSAAVQITWSQAIPVSSCRCCRLGN
jgi:hypothetical protein